MALLDGWLTLIVVVALLVVVVNGSKLADEVFAAFGWAATWWAGRRGRKRSPWFERFTESRNRQQRLPDADTFALMWRPGNQPPNWREAPEQQAARLQAYEVASAVAVRLAEIRNLAYARLKKLPGAPVTEAHEGWRLLLAEIVRADSNFESLMLSPGEAMHAAERLRMLPQERWRTRFPLEDHLMRLMIERRYEFFLDAVGHCRERLAAGMPDAAGVDPEVVAEITYRDCDAGWAPRRHA